MALGRWLRAAPDRRWPCPLISGHRSPLVDSRAARPRGPAPDVWPPPASDEGCAVVDQDDIAGSFRGHPTLSNEQAQVVAHLCCSGNGIDVVTAPAGAGQDVHRGRRSRCVGAVRLPGDRHRPRRPSRGRTAGGRRRASTTLDSLLIALDGRDLPRRPNGGRGRRSRAWSAPASWAGSSITPRRPPPRSCWSATPVNSRRSTPAAFWPDCGPAAGRRAHGEPPPTGRSGSVTRSTQLRDRRHRHRLRRVLPHHGRISSAATPRTPAPGVVADWWVARLAGDDVVDARRAPLRRRRPQPAEPADPSRADRPAFTGPDLLVDGARSRRATRSATCATIADLRVRNGDRGASRRSIRSRAPIVDRPSRQARVVLPTEYLSRRPRRSRLRHDRSTRRRASPATGLHARHGQPLPGAGLRRHEPRPGSATTSTSSAPKPLDPDSTPHAPTTERSADDVLLTGLAASRRQTLASDHIEDASLLTWTTADLLDAERRLGDVLAAAPEDRTHDSDALGVPVTAPWTNSPSSIGATTN